MRIGDNSKTPRVLPAVRVWNGNQTESQFGGHFRIQGKIYAVGNLTRSPVKILLKEMRILLAISGPHSETMQMEWNQWPF
jgi:hypothetical protein